MFRMDDIDTAALTALREVGYDPQTGDQALTDAMKYLRCGAEGATVFLTGEGDRVDASAE